MKTVVRLLPTGNVTITYQDRLRHTHCVPGNTHTRTQMYWALHVQRCLRFSQCWTCIFKLICQTHESVHADTFTYELGCRGPGCDSGWQVLCHFPRVIGRAESQSWQEWRQKGAFHSTVSLQWHNLSLCFSHIPAFGRGEVTFGLCAHVTHTCRFTFICGRSASSRGVGVG